MRKVNLVLITMAAAVAIIMTACDKEGGNRTNISQTGGRSHNTGRNCMDCHVSGGEGSGWFTAAGTVYDTAETATYSNTVVQLYTQPRGGGQLVATLYGDAKGNFYTTASIDFSNGLYPAVTGTGRTNYMAVSITQGACNGCHGVSTLGIYAN